jgi:hypothetical protein
VALGDVFFFNFKSAEEEEIVVVPPPGVALPFMFIIMMIQNL